MSPSQRLPEFLSSSLEPPLTRKVPDRCTLPPPHCIPDAEENFWHLSVVGVVFTIVCTWSGFVLLFIGTLWNANILDKVDEFKS